MPITTAAHILRAARHIFYWRGVQMTSVSDITDGAGISPAGLYSRFDSKDDLLLAYVEETCTRYQEWFGIVTSHEIGSPRARIIALFAATSKQIGTVAGRGCPLTLLLSEFPDRDSPVYQRALACKRWLRDQITQLTSELETEAPSSATELLADQLVLVIEGMYTAAQIFGPEGPSNQAGAIAEALLQLSAAN